MRTVEDFLVDFTAQHEGEVLRAYDDAQPSRVKPARVIGTPTIGYGHTLNVTAADVTNGKAITHDDAIAFLRVDLQTAIGRLYGVVDAAILDSELTDHQFAALVDFVFNLGADSKWTIWKELNARHFDQVPAQMMRFVNAGGRKLEGLVKRRADEVVMWSTSEPGSRVEAPPSSVTRNTETPPASMVATPLAQQHSFVAAATTALVSGGTAIKAVSDAVSPYAGKHPLIDHTLSGLALAGCGLAGLTAVLLWFKNQKAQH